MSAKVFCSAARRSLSSSLSRRTGTPCSQISSRIQGSGTCTSRGTSGRTRLSHSHIAAVNVRDPLDSTRLDRYLTAIGEVDLEPTLEDIERCKPEGFSRPESPRYATEYTDLLETICRSFSKNQLRRFTELYKLDPIWTRSSRRKTEYAESIIEKAWGWPSLKEIERKRRDTTEVLVKSFNVTPSQLFLIMGKDGTDLLQLSMQFNAHISLTSSPLALRVEGLRGSLKGVTEYISSLKKGMIDEIFELPAGRPIQQDFLQRISRVSGAYVENHGNRGKVRICAKYVSDISAAKRLALRASLEAGIQARTVCYDPPRTIGGSPIEISEPDRYSIYPFATPFPIEWAIHPGGAFRLRRVADWLGIDKYKHIASTGGLANNPHCMLNLDQSEEKHIPLVFPITPEGASYRRITASLGHILISTVNKSQRSAIFPPFASTLSLPEVLKWVETSETSLDFIPSIPPIMMTVASDKRRTSLQLTYRTLSQKTNQLQHVLKFEVELFDPPLISPQGLIDMKDTQSSNPNSSIDSHSSEGDVSRPNSLKDALDNGWGSTCQVGRETYINLMLPHRSMDLELCVFDWDSVALTEQPQVLRDYASELRHSWADKAQMSQPNPPLNLIFEGSAYYLHNSLSLRQCKNPNLLSTISSDYDADDSVEVCSESIVDHQSAQKMEFCRVKFDGAVEGPSWRRFLATCDQLSAGFLNVRSNGDEPSTDYLDK